jgi:hypothetical protein
VEEFDRSSSCPAVEQESRPRCHCGTAQREQTAIAPVRHEAGSSRRDRPTTKPRRRGAGVGPKRSVARRTPHMPARIVEDVAQRIPSVERVGEQSRAVPVRKDPTMAAHDAIQRTRQPNRQALHPPRQGKRVLGFGNEMEMALLDGVLDQAKSFLVIAAAERSVNRAEYSGAAQAPQAGRELERYVGGGPATEGSTRNVPNARGAIPRTAAMASGLGQRWGELLVSGRLASTPEPGAAGLVKFGRVGVPGIVGQLERAGLAEHPELWHIFRDAA